ncbi:DUF5047 domain-containing protein [Nonomuraea sp. K274]|uniref:DUF5047 domain-containing protein n=1 Tax=Nonomuraea cypriaca TaxID=1187855 RepID=A0A931F119_9ACTN|nr:DUF5047 domain-containing protein [Nonomuraea cypriaca]MBF8189127.1 DUF5047 domain-containing protein [Nonomuraea cypriaca]
MKNVSEAFESAVRGSHQMVSRARVCSTFQTGTNPEGEAIPILAGDVLMDASSDIRATLDMTTVGEWPDKPHSLLAPYGNEIFVERGIRYGSGDVEYVPLGYFRIYAPEQDEAPHGSIRISAKDRMSGIVDARLFYPRQFTSGTSLGDIFLDLVREVYPDAVIEWDDDTNEESLTRSQIAEEDRYAFLRDLVTSYGKVMFFDHRGVLVIKTPPASKVPVFTVNHGRDGVLVSVSRQLTREGVYNAVVAMGEAADTEEPVRAVVVDSNANSPTYFYGNFGKVPRFYVSPFITTSVQAISAATSILSKELGLPYNVDFTAVPNPALEPLDPVKITFPKGRAEVHIIERITIPLDASGVLSASSRQATNMSIGAPSDL